MNVSPALLWTSLHRKTHIVNSAEGATLDNDILRIATKFYSIAEANAIMRRKSQKLRPTYILKLAVCNAHIINITPPTGMHRVRPRSLDRHVTDYAVRTKLYAMDAERHTYIL